MMSDGIESNCFCHINIIQLVLLLFVDNDCMIIVYGCCSTTYQMDIVRCYMLEDHVLCNGQGVNF